MAVCNTYAGRLRAAEKVGQPEVYTYDSLPSFLRAQLAMVFKAGIGPYESRSSNGNALAWDALDEIMTKEIETFSSGRRTKNPLGHCLDYLRESGDVTGVISFVELCCRMIDNFQGDTDHQLEWLGITQSPADALEEINERFRQHEVGYQYESGEIVRVDSQFVHAEVVKPALALLSAPEFADANAEFRRAHEHYRAGHYRDCNTAALRSMESVLKAICDARAWPFDEGAPVERLIRVVRDHELFPAYLGGSMDSLVAAMKGLPKVRDSQGAHGAAPSDPPVPAHIAGYALHLAAANIVMLVEAHRALK